MASEIVRDRLATRSSFGIETTMNMKADLALIRRAGAAGFATEALIVWSGGFEVSLERVRLRVQRKGHDVPPEEIRSRYEAALEALAVVVAAVDLATVIDNSRPTENGPEIVLRAENGVIRALVDRPPGWLLSAFDRWKAPLRLHEDVTSLAVEPRVYRAKQMLAADKMGRGRS